MSRYRIGIDVGGTHTDMVLFDAADNSIVIGKLPSTPHNPAIAVLDGVKRFIAEGVAPGDIGFFGHGTTVATNALLEMKGGPIGVLVNRNMRGILEVQSQARDGWSPFDHFFRKPEPLARPSFVKEIGGRIDYAGAEIEALNEDDVVQAAKSLAEKGVRSFAICFLFSFMNKTHEERAAELIRAAAPDAFVSCSSHVLPRIREWPRYSTTLLNAFLAPVLSRYCGDMARGLDAADVSTRQRFLMQSNGGVMPLAADAQVHTVRTLLSGPAAGVRGASYLLGQAQGWRNLVTMDIGGTSCDIAFIENGEPVEQAEATIDGRIAAVPAFDIATVAAGGGSIAWIGASGLIEVGPRSAGASPGPVCYGKGGEEPTVTDANLLRGALNADYFLGGSMKLDLAAARGVLDKKIARPMNTDVETAACGIVRIVNARMVDAIRVEAAKKGIDLAGHTLVPFGGGGPVHAAQVAEQLGMRRVLVPRNPGAFSALGLLCSDVRHDYMRSGMADISTLDPAFAEASFASLETQARAEISAEGLDESRIVFEREFDMRYVGQGYELRISLSGLPVPLDRDALDAAALRFHDIHAEAHGHAARDNTVEVVSYRLRAIVPMPKFEPQKKMSGASATPRAIGERRILLDAGREVSATVWRRDDLAADFAAEGPAIIEQLDATTLVPDGWRFGCDAYDNIVLERTGA